MYFSIAFTAQSSAILRFNCDFFSFLYIILLSDSGVLSFFTIISIITIITDTIFISVIIIIIYRRKGRAARFGLPNDT